MFLSACAINCCKNSRMLYDSSCCYLAQGRIIGFVRIDCCCHEITSGHITDVSDIKYVINFDYPNNSEDYVHRIGRTGRSDNKGVSYTFFTKENAPKTRDLIKVLEEAKQNVPEALRKLAVSGAGNGRGRGKPGSKRPAAFGGFGDFKKPRYNNSYGGGSRW